MDIIETGMVLAKIQAFDNRNVEPETTLAWQEVLEPYTLHDALRAVSDYFRTNSAWIMPAHIVERVREVEQGRAYKFTNGYHLNRADEERTLEHGEWSALNSALGRAIRTGAITPAAYDAYQDSDQHLEAFLTNQKAIQ